MTSFTLSHYAEMLTQFIQKGYEFVTYNDVVADKKHIILRHDIDQSISYAISMAKVEQSLGISAHYFVLINTGMYNVFYQENIERIEQLISLGHKIGLHFDPSFYHDKQSMETAATRECTLLESITGSRVNEISFHRPNPNLLDSNEIFCDRISSYGKKLYSEIGYCSDSQGRWRFGEPLSHPAVLEGKALQLLTHPIWWQQSDVSAIEKLIEFHTNQCSQLQKELAKNSIPYMEYLNETGSIPENLVIVAPEDIVNTNASKGLSKDSTLRGHLQFRYDRPAKI